MINAMPTVGIQEVLKHLCGGGLLFGDPERDAPFSLVEGLASAHPSAGFLPLVDASVCKEMLLSSIILPIASKATGPRFFRSGGSVSELRLWKP